MTTDKDLDRAFSEQESIQPSSGFASSVMDAVRAAQLTPPPIVFPWKRALPGLLIAVAMVIAVFAAWFGFLVLGKTGSTASLLLVHWFNRPFHLGLTWIAFALVVTCGCVKLSMKIAYMRF